MKFVVITQNAPIYLHCFLEKFFDGIGKTKHECAGIAVLPAAGKGIFAEALARFRMYGPVDFFRISFRIAVHILRSFLFGLKPAGPCHSVRNVVKKFGLPLMETKAVNSESFIAQIKERETDLLISIASPRVLKKPLIESPKKGTINYHSALLPRYRGIQPLFWALLNGETEVGVSVHEIDEKLDNGPILVQRRIPVDAEDTLDSLYFKTFEIGPDALIDGMDMIENESAVRIENPPDQASYFSFPTSKDLRAFKARGKRLL